MKSTFLIEAGNYYNTHNINLHHHHHHRWLFAILLCVLRTKLGRMPPRLFLFCLTLSRTFIYFVFPFSFVIFLLREIIVGTQKASASLFISSNFFFSFFSLLFRVSAAIYPLTSCFVPLKSKSIKRRG